MKSILKKLTPSSAVKTEWVKDVFNLQKRNLVSERFALKTLVQKIAPLFFSVSEFFSYPLRVDSISSRNYLQDIFPYVLPVGLV